MRRDESSQECIGETRERIQRAKTQTESAQLASCLSLPFTQAHSRCLTRSLQAVRFPDNPRTRSPSPPPAALSVCPSLLLAFLLPLFCCSTVPPRATGQQSSTKTEFHVFLCLCRSSSCAASPFFKYFFLFLCASVSSHRAPTQLKWFAAAKKISHFSSPSSPSLPACLPSLASQQPLELPEQ